MSDVCNLPGIEQDGNVTIEQYSDLIEKYLERERRTYFALLLKSGYSQPINVFEMGRNLGIEFSGGNFAVLCLNIDDLYSLFFESDIIYNEENLNTAFFITSNVIQDIVGKLYQCILTQVDSWMIFIISVDGTVGNFSAERFISQLRASTQESLDFIENNFGLKLSAIISNIYEGLSGIPVAYSEATSLRNYKRFLGLDDRVMYYGDYYRKEADIDEIINEPCTESKEFSLIMHFMKSVRKGDYAEAKNVMAELVHDSLFATTPAIQVVSHTYYGLNHLFFIAIEEIRLKSHGDKNIVIILRPNERLSTDLPIKKIQQNMENLFDYLATYKNPSSIKPPPVWLHELAEYVSKNYTDVNINITSAAEHLGISPAYASRMFKNQFGIGIMERINELRLEKAKRLIASGESISETANLVGYGSVITMRRAFKRYEGYTPSSLIWHITKREA